MTNAFADEQLSHDPEKIVTMQQIRMSKYAEVSEDPMTTIDISEVSESEKEWSPTTKELWIMITLAVSSLVVALDATILVPVLPTLAHDLHGTSAEAFWTGTSYLLAHSVLQPFIASLGDVFGRRATLTPSLLLFAVGSVVCGVSHNFKTMLVGRVIQGMGGAGIITLSQIVFADLVPLRQRPKYFTMVLGAWAVGSVLGPLVGGLLVEKATWRWCFYLNLPILAVATPLAIWSLGHIEKPATDIWTKIRSIDWIGNTLFITTVTWTLIGISWAGIQFEWSDWPTIVPLVVGGIGVVVSIAYEYYFAKQPFLSKRIFANTSAVASYAAAMFQGLALYMALYYLSFYFSAARLYSPIRGGLSVFPATTCLLPGSAVVSNLITRYGKYRWAIWIGWTISTLASGLFILWDDKTKTPVWAACECIFGAGMGMILSSVNASIQAAVAPEDAGQAAAMYAFMRSIGMTIGVAVGGTVFQNTMKQKLHALNVPRAADIAKNSEGFLEQFRHMARTGQEGMIRDNIMAGYVAGFRGVWMTMAGFCAAGLVVSLVIKSFSMDKILASKFQVQEQEKKPTLKRVVTGLVL